MQSHAAAAVAADSVPILTCITSADVCDLCRFGGFRFVVKLPAIIGNECCIVAQAALSKCCCGHDLRSLTFRLT